MPNDQDWLGDFVECFQHGEAPPRLLYWVGVSTIAGALGRKVWIDEEIFRWYPNFYILVVGVPGEFKKSTSISLGMSMLQDIGIDLGPEISTWQALITHFADCARLVRVGDEEQEMSCVTLELSEFGTFFDTSDHWLVDVLTRLWDNKPGPLTKTTKKDGNEIIANPWLNLIAGTTPEWVTENFRAGLAGTGLASRMIYIHHDIAARDVSYPSRSKNKAPKSLRTSLVDRLRGMVKLNGPAQMTEAAYVWGDEWYKKSKERSRASQTEIERNFFAREQSHLHKLAIVISASRGKYPKIDVPEMIEADKYLQDLSADSRRVFNVVGQTNISKAALKIIDMLELNGPMSRRELYRRGFFRTISIKDFMEAMASALVAGIVQQVGSRDDPMISIVQRK